MDKARYLANVARLYDAPHPVYVRRRNSCHCLRCYALFGYYDRLEFDSHGDIPNVCPTCAKNEAGGTEKGNE